MELFSYLEIPYPETGTQEMENIDPSVPVFIVIRLVTLHVVVIYFIGFLASLCHLPYYLRY